MMKKLKKFAALLLVGVMALALLTACGGGGSGEDAQAEASVMTAINSKRTAAAKLDNDAERKAVACGYRPHQGRPVRLYICSKI